MPALFKLSGLLLLFLSCSAFGFWRSFCISKRAQKLEQITRSCFELGARIKTEKKELSRVISLCFSKETVFIKNERPVLNKSFLENRDIELLEEFFASFGMRDKASEYERVKLFCAILEKESSFAGEKAKKLCRLYNTLGLLFGLSICIFFL